MYCRYRNKRYVTSLYSRAPVGIFDVKGALQGARNSYCGVTFDMAPCQNLLLQISDGKGHHFAADFALHSTGNIV